MLEDIWILIKIILIIPPFNLLLFAAVFMIWDHFIGEPRAVEQRKAKARAEQERLDRLHRKSEKARGRHLVWLWNLRLQEKGISYNPTPEEKRWGL